MNAKDKAMRDFLLAQDNIEARKLDDGTWVTLHKLMFTLAVCVGATEILAYTYRYCFENPDEAVKFYNEIKSLTDVPQSRESLVGHRFTVLEPLLEKNDEINFTHWIEVKNAHT